MDSREFSQKIDDAKEPNTNGGWWGGLCPAHDDRSPSFGWRDGGKKIVLKCQAGWPPRKQVCGTPENLFMGAVGQAARRPK